LEDIHIPKMPFGYYERKEATIRKPTQQTQIPPEEDRCCSQFTVQMPAIGAAGMSTLLIPATRYTWPERENLN
jgi:hypothetical protein